LYEYQKRAISCREQYNTKNWVIEEIPKIMQQDQKFNAMILGHDTFFAFLRIQERRAQARW
jgi:hypothetical protein